MGDVEIITEPQAPTRKFRAQERYAQRIVDWLWENADTMLEANADGVFYKGSLHQLIKRTLPSAQAGEVVNILRDTGCVSTHAQGIWEIKRKNVFVDDETGEEIDLSKVSQFGHATKAKQTASDLNQVNKRLLEVEGRVATLTSIVIGWAEERGETIPDVTVEEDEGGEDEEDDTDAELGRDVVGDDGA
jgi:hypothetical protein